LRFGFDRGLILRVPVGIGLVAGVGLVVWVGVVGVELLGVFGLLLGVVGLFGVVGLMGGNWLSGVDGLFCAAVGSIVARLIDPNRQAVTKKI
jgi:hypothetical protein